MNLHVSRGRRRPYVFAAFTHTQKPRCQMEMFRVGERQCTRPARVFEPHHPQPNGYYKVEPSPVYGENKLFGYCKQHSMAENHRLIDAEEAATLARHEQKAAETNRKNRRREMFDMMIGAIIEGDTDGIYEEFYKLVNDGLRPSDIHVNEGYL